MCITDQREAGSEYSCMWWACSQRRGQHRKNDSKPFTFCITFNIIWQVSSLHHIQANYGDCVLSGLRRKSAKQLYLVTMVTVLGMNKKERKRAKRAPRPRNQVYLKVIYLSEIFLHLRLFACIKCNCICVCIL